MGKTYVSRLGLKNVSYMAEYHSWTGMRHRCNAVGSRDYPKYGGRGIKLCTRWNDSFDNFYEDMGPQPIGEYSIDRIDNNGNYEPGNCRWATKQQQVSNRSHKNSTGYFGVYKRGDQVGKWTAKIEVDGEVIHLGTFTEPKEAARAFDMVSLREHGKDAVLNNV